MPATFARIATLLVAGGAVLLLAVACDDNRRFRDGDCDYTGQRCQTVCDYWCDSWGCYPVCWDQCWGECYRNPDPAPTITAPADASTPPPAVTDASSVPVPPAPGDGALCSPCIANDQCANSVCILRGGPVRDASASDASVPGNGFCGQTCGGGGDCPAGFACSSIGSSSQCLPTSASSGCAN